MRQAIFLYGLTCCLLVKRGAPLGLGPESERSAALRRPAGRWNVSEVQGRLGFLTSGTYTRGGKADSFYEYHLPDGRGSFKPKHFSQEDIRQCLSDKWVHFFGDSRLRFLYASTIANLFGPEQLDQAQGCPHHRACPKYNFWGKHSQGCVKYFKGVHNGTCWERQLGSTRVTFEWNQWAKPGVSANSPLRTSGRRPDVVFVNNGLWATWNNQRERVHADDAPLPGTAKVQEDQATHKSAEEVQLSPTPPFGPEGTEDRLRLFREIGSLAGGDTLKVWTGYARCAEQFYSSRDIPDLEQPLKEWAAQSDWVAMDPFNLSYPIRPTKRLYTTIWSKELQPLDTVPATIKWDTCDGPHTTDSLADLEMQVLYNVLCQ